MIKKIFIWTAGCACIIAVCPLVANGIGYLIDILWKEKGAVT